MSCAKWQERIGELSAGELSPRQAAEVQAHLDGCAECARIHRETRAVVSLLRHAGDEPLPEGFGLELHRKLATEPVPARPGRLRHVGERLRDWLTARPARNAFAFAGIGALVAATALGAPSAMWVLRHRVHGAPVLAGEVPPIFMVPREKIAVVHIDFHAEEAIEDVEFAIKLPEGLHFVSEGRELPEREFRWRGRLAAGSNPIPVAVRGKRPGRYTLAAHAIGPDVAAQHNVVLEVTS